MAAREDAAPELQSAPVLRRRAAPVRGTGRTRAQAEPGPLLAAGGEGAPGRLGFFRGLVVFSWGEWRDYDTPLPQGVH